MFNCRITCSRVVMNDLSTLLLSITSPMTKTTLSLEHGKWNRCAELINKIYVSATGHSSMVGSPETETFTIDLILSKEEMTEFYKAVSMDWAGLPPETFPAIPITAYGPQYAAYGPQGPQNGLHVRAENVSVEKQLKLGEPGRYYPTYEPAIDFENDAFCDIGSSAKRARVIYSQNIQTQCLQLNAPTYPVNSVISGQAPLFTSGAPEEYIEIYVNGNRRLLKVV